MQRHDPVVSSDEIDLYVRTYHSLLRSSGEVRVRAFEEAHSFSASALHAGALSPVPDVSAFAYAAGRLPDEMPDVKLVILGQSHELFEAQGYDVRAWKSVRTRGRRRPLRYHNGHLAVFIASVSDIDDLVPILTAYQIEWNKMHGRLRGVASSPELPEPDTSRNETLEQLLGIEHSQFDKLVEAFTPALFEARTTLLAARPLDVRVKMLAGSYSQYQRAAQRWWSGVEPSYLQTTHPRRRPTYFVSSNTHAIANLVGGYARLHAGEIMEYAARRNPEGLAADVSAALDTKSDYELAPFLYYLLRGYLHESPGDQRIQQARSFEAEGGLIHLSEPGHIDIDAQLIEFSKIRPERLDPRLCVPGIERLAESDAVIVNIDYPLGMGAYHLLSRLGQGVGELRGVYVMGKAATLNGRVGDVSLSGTIYDEHSRNTFLFRNAFSARDVSPYLRYGSVFDNQAALTVRSAFLQNEQYMNHYYSQGYTVLEMEAGPFLGAVYELVHPTRSPTGEILHLSGQKSFDVGILHYASDTPYSRRQSLLSKSLSFFGVDATYASAIAIMNRILMNEIDRCTNGPPR